MRVSSVRRFEIRTHWEKVRIVFNVMQQNERPQRKKWG